MHKRNVGAAALVLAAIAQPVMAQRPLNIEVGAFGQYTIQDKDLNIDNGPTIGGRIAIFMLKNLATEIDGQLGKADWNFNGTDHGRSVSDFVVPLKFQSVLPSCPSISVARFFSMKIAMRPPMVGPLSMLRSLSWIVYCPNAPTSMFNGRCAMTGCAMAARTSAAAPTCSLVHGILWWMGRCAGQTPRSECHARTGGSRQKFLQYNA